GTFRPVPFCARTSVQPSRFPLVLPSARMLLKCSPSIEGFSMLDRRSVLMSGSAAAALSASGLARAKAAPQAPVASSEAAKLNKLFDAFMEEIIDQAPEFATNLGIDKGERAYQKFMLGDRSIEQVAFLRRLNTAQLARLKTIDRSKLSGMDAVNY